MDAAPSSRPQPPAFAQPLSFGGVAEIAGRPLAWLGFWQLTVAAIAGIVVAWAADATWGRALRQAAGLLPDQAAIRSGRLEWPSATATTLHQGPFVSLVVDPAGHRDSALASDVTVFVETEGLAFRSLFGWMVVPYPGGGELPLGRLEFSANLSAWEGPARLGIGIATAAGLLVTWWLLSFVYGAVLRVGSGLLGRSPGFGTAWRTAGAALLAPSLLMTAAILLYATRNLTFLGLLLAFPLHLVAGWIYCAGGWASLPPVPAPVANPFDTAPEPPAAPQSAHRPANPFQAS